MSDTNNKYFHVSEGDAKPREKAFANGVDSLSDAELIALIIGFGAKGSGVMDVSEQVCRIIDDTAYDLIGIQEILQKIHGLGYIKSMKIVAALELGRRRYAPGLHPVRCPEDAWKCIRHYGDRRQEFFFVLCLNGARELNNYEIVTKGLLNRSLVHPREVFAPAIENRSASVIVAHNHPSGNLKPSTEDKNVTDRLKDAGNILGIEVVDHIVFSNTDFYSFRQEGIL